MRPVVLAALLASPLALGACADGDGGALFIEGIVVPDDDCSLPGNPQLFSSSGFVSVGTSGGYVLTPFIRNGLVDISVVNDGTSDASSVNVQGAEIALLNLNEQLLDLGVNVPNPYFVGSGAVVTGGSAAPASFVAIPPAVLERIPGALDPPLERGQQADIVLGTKLNGRTIGGDFVEAPEHQYTITVYFHDDPAAPTQPSCVDNVTVFCGTGEEEDEDAATACFVGQDGVFLFSPACQECNPTGIVPCCPPI